ncbi:hypothetical protein [Lachnobacterium bovis]|uniref:Uncharacterized protein n=1 Tax=Lachnobacterium bovis TaxID=140626 RepID=A0A1H9T013_9FIRM|nr:hypothetical protein [Lachnobacterium bovis]SER90461.1 hypothetical protein SAMN02910429_01446 [Lachnobacterium bovis]
MQYNNDFNYIIKPKGNRKKVKDFTKSLLAVLMPFQAIIALISCIPFRESIELTIQVSRREKCNELLYTTSYEIWSNFMMCINVLIILIIIYDIIQIKRAGYKIFGHILVLFLIRDIYLLYRTCNFNEKLSFADIISVIGGVFRMGTVVIMAITLVHYPEMLDILMKSNALIFR